MHLEIAMGSFKESVKGNTYLHSIVGYYTYTGIRKAIYLRHPFNYIERTVKSI